jgi:hypothetical protein
MKMSMPILLILLRQAVIRPTNGLNWGSNTFKKHAVLIERREHLKLIESLEQEKIPEDEQLIDRPLTTSRGTLFYSSISERYVVDEEETLRLSRMDY